MTTQGFKYGRKPAFLRSKFGRFEFENSKKWKIYKKKLDPEI
jgi:hypothetical protein